MGRHESFRATPNAPAAARSVPVLFPNCYSWYVFLASMDVMMTAIILHPFFGGSEVNVLARWVLERGGLPAAILYKFALVAIVILICEIIGRRRPETGRRLAEWAVAITAIPVVVAFVQLLVAVGVIAIGQ
jgi:Domain of unknown function (DUF5658)